MSEHFDVNLDEHLDARLAIAFYLLALTRSLLLNKFRNEVDESGCDKVTSSS